MKRVQIIIFIFFVLLACVLMAGENEILNLYENFGEEAGEAIFDWGFSALIRYNGKVILFDGGTSAEILEHNAKVLSIDPAEVDIAVLSHSHNDHLAGFDYLLKVNPDVKLFFPNDWTIGGGSEKDAERNRKYQRGYRFRDANIRFVRENTQIAPGITLIATTSSLTGWFSKYPPHENEPVFFGLPELSLALQAKDGQYMLIVGCSHSQVDEIVREAKKYLGKNVMCVAGGFHLLPYSSDYISDVAKMMKDKLQVSSVAPAHCTGDSAQEIFKALYKENYRYFGLGSRFKF